MKRICLLSLAFLLLLGACSAPTPPNTGGTAQDSNGYRAPVYDGMQDTTDTMYEQEDSESYLEIRENEETMAAEENTLTFSLKVDTASYTNMVRYIESGNAPPPDAVRTEEMINYFSYEAEMAFLDGPFSIYTEVGLSPFDSQKHLAFVRVKTPDIDKSELPHSNLTFLIDSSGSMDSYDKLPLLKEAFGLLTDTLGENDKVSIVTYAGSSAVLLDGVSGADTKTIQNAIEKLTAGGSTAGADGINTAYALAEKNFIKDGNNRVILATDGDFNVGISDIDDLEEFISEKKDSGVYLSVLGFGTGNIRDDIMETLSAKGNGNYSYINSVRTAKKVLVDELASNLYTVADDVKAQVAFNSDTVKSYRLIGYENRMMSNDDFEDDTKDAGEIGVGTDVVMLFEMELYPNNPDAELFDVRIRYKEPGKSESKLTNHIVTGSQIASAGSSDFCFASSVAAFAHLLRGSHYARDLRLDDVIAMARDNLGGDPNGYRSEFVDLLRAYGRIKG